MGYLIAVAALLLILWIEEKESWQLAAATVLLAGAMLTKREGMLFAACVLLAGFVASFAERRQTVATPLRRGARRSRARAAMEGLVHRPRLPVDRLRHGYDGVVSDLDRLWPALEISLRTLFHRICGTSCPL